MYSQDVKCDREEVLKIADSMMKKTGYDLSIYNRTIIEKETFFLIQYNFIQDGIIRIGGGGEITISKETCKIIDKKFYQ
jgi:hypothetical protein